MFQIIEVSIKIGRSLIDPKIVPIHKKNAAV
jgi:hypothetical protein